MSISLIPVLQSKDELHAQPTFNARRMGRGELAKKPLTAADYHRLREKFDSIIVEKPDADTTKRNIVAVQNKWQRYCEMMQKGDPSAALLKCSKGDCMAFLTWICETYKIPKKRQKYDSVSVSWRAFKMLFARCTGYQMNANAKKEVSDFLAGTLKKRYKLDVSVKPKPVISADDLLVLLSYLWASDDSVMPDEEQRVQLATILLFAAFTGSRPAELMDASLSAKDKKKIKDAFWRKTTPWDNPDDSDYDEAEVDPFERTKSLCWEDIELRIVALDDGRMVLAMWIAFTHHKGVDRKPLPTIFCFTEEEQPIFDPIAHLITLALHRGVFAANNIKSAADVYSKVVPSRLKSIHLQWKEEMLKKPIFCQARAFTLSNIPSLHSTAWIKGWIQEDLTSYCFRRGTGNAVDGSASKAIRDRVMRHNPEAATFQKYLNPKLNFSVQAAMLERPSDEILLKAMSHMSLTRDPAAPVKAPKSYVDSLPQDENLCKLEKEREELATYLKEEFGAIKHAVEDEHADQYKKLCAAIKAAKMKRTTEANISYRKLYHKTIQRTEIEQQGKDFKDTPYVEPVVNHQLQERRTVQGIMCNTAKKPDGLDGREQRVLAVSALLALCCRREDRPGRRPASDSDKGTMDWKIEDPSIAMDVDDKPFEDPFPMLLDPRQCPVCIGNEQLSTQQRTRTWYTIWNMWDHAEKHFQGVPSCKPYICRHPKCDGKLLNDVTHFKNHCALDHNSRLRG